MPVYITNAKAEDDARTVFAQRTLSAVSGNVLCCGVCASSRSCKVDVVGEGGRECDRVFESDVNVPMNVWISFIGGSAGVLLI